MFPTCPKFPVRPAVLLAALTLLSITTVLYFQRATLSPHISAHLSRLSELTQDLRLSLSSHWSSVVDEQRQCPFDPFHAPGMIYWGNAANQTRWVPFPRDLETYSDSEKMAKITELERDWEGLTEPEMMELGAADRFMWEMVEGGGEWARGRNILILGDRNNIVNFCKIMKGTIKNWGGHTGGWCRVESIDLTIVWWFLFGIVDSEYPWYVDNEKEPKTFDHRIDEIFLPRMEKEGLREFTPDLGIVNSLYWDSDHLFDQYDRQFNLTRKQDQGLTYQEVRYHQTHSAALVRRLRALYGTFLPLMYRARHIRASNYRGLMLRITQLDQGWRAVSETMGLKVLEWGERLEGYTDFYDTRQHFPPGPVTWFFGDMMLFYLKQAMDPERWWACLWQ
ncbi:hypothetical protein DACRYDRAFT_109589 [Dacryopinax primogenitus]|uniref:Uncharacterized protein n=1 Tax=Dacryopinax primogenitus (strain DJM 731) TaxID=1858805 RepID=M5FV57_DACPD|nr:uncharacterized protein DACRYDRAFT_109589 [Dacryopinax primogenitus]EJT99484.1 hypothetical protein DACRYDRAFT_109589 [Dacryopinax primogenitus]